MPLFGGGGGSTPASPSAGVSGFTAGSIPFGGSDGGFDQDNANLFWDDTDDAFKAGVRSGFSSGNPAYFSGNATHLFTNLDNPSAQQISDTEMGTLVGISEDDNGISTYGVVGIAVQKNGDPGGLEATGGMFQGIISTDNTTTGAYGAFLRANATGAITVGHVTGLRVSNTVSVATVTNNYGVLVDNVSGATNNYAIKTGTGRVDFGGKVNYLAPANFASTDATPSVALGNVFKTANGAGTTITAFDDGTAGQEITVIINDANTTIDFTGTTLKGNGGSDWSPTTGDHMVCMFDGTNWYCRISDNTA